MAKIYIADRFYIPQKLVKEEDIIKNFEKYVYKQNMCNRCDVFRSGERFSELCSTCDGFTGYFKTYKETEIKGKDYYAVPAGDIKGVAKTFNIKLERHKIKDMRSNVKAKNPLKFRGKLYTGTEVVNGVTMANQVQIIKDLFGEKSGLVESAPRTGKTVVAVYAITKYKRRVLVIAHEKQLLRQFLRTLLDFTNLKKRRKKTGNKIAGIIQKDSDWNEDLDIVLCTYQKFISTKGFKRVRRHLIKKFGLLIVDECHRSNATAYINFISKLDMKYKIGLSATMTRKDRLEFLMHQMLGPIVAKSNAVAQRPKLEVIETEFKPTREWRGKAAYTFTNRWLATQRERNKLIVKNVFKDLRENKKHSIIIPVLFVKHVETLTKLINAQAEYNNENKGENWPEKLALPYHGKINTSVALTQVRERKSRVLIAIRKMVKEGLNVPAWTHMYLQFPMNNEEDFWQMTQRICTPYEGKPEAIIRTFVDSIGLSYGCFAATYGHAWKFKYNIPPYTQSTAKRLISRSGKRVSNSDVSDLVW
jgi:superfamily II DNA or RNA helicase